MGGRGETVTAGVLKELDVCLSTEGENLISLPWRRVQGQKESQICSVGAFIYPVDG